MTAGPAPGRAPVVVESPPLGSWARARAVAPAGWLHGPGLPVLDRRLVRVAEADWPALVLGSAQDDAVVDMARAAGAGLEVARRRSGGGLVLIDPGRVVWVDLVVPAHDPLADDDVGRAAWWVGEVWAGALADLGVAGATVHTGPMVHARWSRTACFAGLGAGEVTVAGRKVVGVSQRRTRAGALFQTAVHLVYDPLVLVECLTLDGRAARDECLAELTESAVGLADVLGPGAGVDGEGVVGALLRHLPQA